MRGYGVTLFSAITLYITEMRGATTQHIAFGLILFRRLTLKLMLGVQ